MEEFFGVNVAGIDVIGRYSCNNDFVDSNDIPCGDYTYEMCSDFMALYESRVCTDQLENECVEWETALVCSKCGCGREEWVWRSNYPDVVGSVEDGVAYGEPVDVTDLDECKQKCDNQWIAQQNCHSFVPFKLFIIKRLQSTTCALVRCDL